MSATADTGAQMHAPVTTARGNDHRVVAAARPLADPRVSVVVPVHERVELLARTIAGLAAQDDPPDEVIVVDDGSTEDVTAAVTSADELPVRVLRLERDGYGAARARNAGAAAATGDVLLLLDADCIPTPGLVGAHRWWHARSSSVVVAGPRRDVDSSAMDPSSLRRGDVDLHAAVGTDAGARRIAPDGWRALFQRRSKDLLLGDAAFRAATSANLSVPRWLFELVGGFDEGFGSWGGEDTELAWRLWNEGAIVVPEQRALALHQVQLDATDRERGRARAVPVVADLVPARFYRPRPTPLALVPSVSWVVAVHGQDDVVRAEQWLAEATPSDVELVLHGPVDVLGHLVDVATRNPRRTVVAEDDPAAAATTALTRTRGAVVVLVDGAVRRPVPVVARAVRDLEASETTTVARSSYTVGGDRYLRLSDLAAVDGALAGGGLPLFAVVRRRELAKHLHAAVGAGESVSSVPHAGAVAWSGVLAAGTPSLSIVESLRVESDAPEAPPTPGVVPAPRDAAAVGAREAARIAVRAARRVAGRADRPAARPDPGAAPDDELVPVEYVGLTGQRNLGDDAVRIAVERLMPWARFGVDVPDARLLLVGGGTLLNGKRYYLTRMLRHESPVLERVLFGTGVRNPEYHGVTEPMEEWSSFIDTAVHASLRGPDSVANLRSLGHPDELPITGDPAFSLWPSDDVDRVDGRVVLCPVWTGGDCHGGDDEAVFEAFAATTRRLRAAGREVVLLSAFPFDDRWIIELMRRAGVPDLPYVIGYDSVDDTVDLLASADLVIGERLHAAILAASAGTPFVAVQYRPKVLDFARSVDQEDAVVRTDEIERLDEVVDTVLAEAASRTATVSQHVERYRDLQRAAADDVRRVLLGDR